MKKCDQFRDMILTDYFDGQANKDDAAGVEAHLLDCGACRDFLKEVKSTMLPLQSSAQQAVPAELWTAIGQRIAHENKAAAAWEGFIEGLKGWVVFPRLVPVLASFVVMFLAGSATLNTIQVQRARDTDQGTYLVSLLSPPETAATDASEGPTPIEHYFL